MSQIKKIKEYVDENNRRVFDSWSKTGFLVELSREDAIALAKLFEAIATILLSKDFGDKIECYAFPVARMCLSKLGYLIKNPSKFLSYLEGRVSQVKIDINYDPDDRIAACIRMNDDAELCLEIAGEVKAMKL